MRNGDYSYSKINNMETKDDDTQKIGIKDDDIEQVGMKKTIGLVKAMSIVIGGIIGSGIFASPRMVLMNSGSIGMSLVIWVLCGVISLGAALCMLELGLMIPKSGGGYQYLKAAYGPLPSFLYIYAMSLVARPAGLAILTITCGEYIVTAVVGNGCLIVDRNLLVKLTAATAIGIIIFVNCASSKWAISMHVLFTALKMFAGFIIIFTGFVRVGQGHHENFNDPFANTSTSISHIGYALYGGLWAYAGWEDLNFVIAEVKNPRKVLPIALISSLILITVCYVLINIAYISVLTLGDINSTNAVAVLLANRMYGPMAWIIPVAVACSTFGSAVGTVFTLSRSVYVSSRDGQLPKLFSMVHVTRDTPMPAIVFTSVIAWLMLVPESSNFSTLLNYLSFIAWLFFGAYFAGLILMRYTKPDLERPFKVFLGIPILLIICSIYLVLAPFYDYPLQSFYCLLLVASGIPVYFIFIKYKLLPNQIAAKINWFTYKIQILGDFSIPYESPEEEMKDVQDMKDNKKYLVLNNEKN